MCEKDENGRWVAFAPNMKVPLIMLKSDGGYTYDTSDMAALQQRLADEKGEWLIYVVDAGQVLDTAVFQEASICDCGFYCFSQQRSILSSFKRKRGKELKDFNICYSMFLCEINKPNI